jgi:hypothetical protein
MRAILMAVCLVGVAASVGAQTFPARNKAITLIVGFSAAAARMRAPGFSRWDGKSAGTKVEVLKQAGRFGSTGYTMVAQAKPDGYTIGLASLPESWSHHGSGPQGRI